MSTGTEVGNRTQPVSWWLYLVVALGALLMAAGGVIALIHPAMLVSPQAEITEAVRVYAGYLASRNLVLAILLLAMLALRARRALSHLMVLTGFIQVVDACIDCVEGRWAVVPGVVLFGVVFLVGAARLAGFPFWTGKAWE